MNKAFLLFFTILFRLHAYADGILISWSHNNLSGMTKEKYEDAKTWSTEYILKKNLEVTNWPATYLLLVGAAQHKDNKDFIKALAKQITNTTEVKLQLTSRLVIWERITTGDILFEGKGMQIDDDLFKVSGRANFILRNITNQNFGLVSIKSSATDLTALQTKWTDFIDGKAVEQFKNPFESTTKGLQEIQSLAALEALIVSLKPSPEKETLTKTCLKNIYNLDEMPKEKGSSASYCSPDTYTFSFLGILTGDKKHDETKNYEWWTNWWTQNKGKLEWNKEKSIFEINP